jgi:hypothetical protein
MPRRDPGDDGQHAEGGGSVLRQWQGAAPPVLWGMMLLPALVAPLAQRWLLPGHAIFCASVGYTSGWITRRREASQTLVDLTGRMAGNGLCHPVDNLAALAEGSVHMANLVTRDAHAAFDLWRACTARPEEGQDAAATPGDPGVQTDVGAAADQEGRIGHALPV